jgi:hypothetical protein
MKHAKKLAAGLTIEQKIRINHSDDENEQWQNSEAQNRFRNSHRSTPQSTIISTMIVI